MGATNDQALTFNTRNNFKKKEINSKKTKRDTSNVRCYTCDENGHFARDCHIKKRRHHAHVFQHDEPTNKRFIWDKDDLDEEYVLISALTRTMSYERNDWILYSGACKYMTR